MNKNKLKVYAPQAREEFIKVISERAALYGITEKKIEPFEIKGDYLFISGKPFPKLIDKPRKELIARIESKNFGHVMEEIAYTWFNRFAAIRFMEINGYLEHGYRVLSHPGGHSEPEILEKAHYLESLDGLSKDEIVALKTAGNKDSDLYRKLIIAQCNELHSAMPFLFEKVDDPTELLLPDNLLNTDSITRQLVTAIPEEDWKAVEIIGWLYQFYISEKKDALMKAKKAYKTEDIPAVTQLFTPNWIVKYLVQNSLGAKWLATYPSSKIKEKMEYYIEPAEQTEDVKEQLKTVTPDVLDPEELTVMDPACGSGHILVEAYDLLKEIYLERGYRPKDIPALIITKNLFGLEIDERAAQLSGFALMMKARADDSRIFSKEHIEPNVVCIQETANLDRDGLLRNINTPLTNKSVSASSGEMDFMDEISTPLFAKVAKETDVLTEDEKLTITDLNELLELFESAKTFGSLIRIPEEIMEKLPLIRERLKKASASGDLMARQSADLLKPYFRQTVLMGHQYDCVIANPPYMGSGGMNRKLKEFVAWKYPAAKSDLMTCFMERCKDLSKKNARVGMINLPSWLFLASFEKFRHNLLNSTTIENLTHLGRGLFGADFGSVAFVFRNSKSNYYFGTYRRLFVRQSEVSSVEELKRRYLDSNYGFYKVNQEEFKQVPGYPVVYWISPQMRKAFIESELLENIADARIGMATGNNEQYVRNWHEVNISKVGFQIKSREESKLSCKKWFPLAKGGAFRKWYGNMEHVVDWANDGHALQTTKHPSGERIWAHNFNLEQIFKPAICWTTVTISDTGFRFHPHGFLYDAAAGLCQPKQEKDMYLLLGALNARVSNEAIKLLNPTVNLAPGYLGKIPIPRNVADRVTPNVNKSIDIAESDWNSFETSWDFKNHPMLINGLKGNTVEESFLHWDKRCAYNIHKMKELEEENNRVFIEAYGMEDELTLEVPEDKITLARANKKDDIKLLISYAIGCMMGRYSLDKTGLIYAHSGNEGFDPSQYKTFPADDDGIIPITDHEWFDDDTASRFFKFIETAWDKKGLDANLDFIAEAIGRKPNESSRLAIRRYFVDSFYKDHCQNYKKRPIYWMFTSGKEKVFQALVYLHRYNEGTLSRMRTEYVLPLQTKINRHMEHLEKDKENAASTSAANKIQKEITRLVEQKEELIKFDELLRDYADMKIKLDLDDGVKVNYGKFGELLDNMKAIAGDKDAEDES